MLLIIQIKKRKDYSATHNDWSFLQKNVLYMLLMCDLYVPLTQFQPTKTMLLNVNARLFYKNSIFKYKYKYLYILSYAVCFLIRIFALVNWCIVYFTLNIFTYFEHLLLLFVAFYVWLESKHNALFSIALFFHFKCMYNSLMLSGI